MTSRSACRIVGQAAVLALLAGRSVSGQEPASRASTIERAQTEKAAHLQSYEPGKLERYLNQAENFLGAGLRLHPYFQSAYSGGGFTLGAGYRSPVGAYNTLDVRGSYTLKGYKRVETEFVAPRVLSRQARLAMLGGWREATQVGYFGLGTSTSKDDRVNYGFKQFYGLAAVDMTPARKFIVLGGGIEASQWQQTPGSGSYPSVEEVYSPSALSGLGQTISYIHSYATVGLDTRPAEGYARRGSSVRVSLRDFSDTAGEFGFKRIDYEAIQHVPILRETWVLSFRAAASTTGTKDDQEIPFFMLPSVGGGSSLRGYNSWRFRDRNSLMLQAEWRVMVNRFVDTAVFYDAGKVTAHARNLDLHGLKGDYGLGFRLHSPLATPLRIDFAKGSEGLSIVFSSSASF
jgi:hypothetical protein